MQGMTYSKYIMDFEQILSDPGIWWEQMLK